MVAENTETEEKVTVVAAEVGVDKARKTAVVQENAKKAKMVTSKVDVVVRAVYYVFLHGTPWKYPWYALDHEAWDLIRMTAAESTRQNNGLVGKDGFVTSAKGLHHLDKIISSLLASLEEKNYGTL